MKRYDHICQPMKLRDLCEYSDGNYVLFTDAQADKHAALKELVPYLRHHGFCDYIVNEFECTCGLTELRAKLFEGPV